MKNEKISKTFVITCLTVSAVLLVSAVVLFLLSVLTV